jgi:hypothetical protein
VIRIVPLPDMTVRQITKTTKIKNGCDHRGSHPMKTWWVRIVKERTDG